MNIKKKEKNYANHVQKIQNKRCKRNYAMQVFAVQSIKGPSLMFSPSLKYFWVLINRCSNNFSFICLNWTYCWQNGPAQFRALIIMVRLNVRLYYFPFYM